jgi:hypothetical protein
VCAEDENQRVDENQSIGEWAQGKTLKGENEDRKEDEYWSDLQEPSKAIVWMKAGDNESDYRERQ